MKSGLKIDAQFRVRRGRKSTTTGGRAASTYSRKSSFLKAATQKKAQPSNRVVIKITSGCKTGKQLINHIDYISRNGKLDLVSSENQKFTSRKETKTAKEIFFRYNNKFSHGNDSNKTRETFNLMFSISDLALRAGDKNQSKQLLQESVVAILKEKFPSNYFVFSVHEDTDHPHIHVCLNKVNEKTNKRIDIRKNDLKDLKHKFSSKLIDNGFNVEKEKPPVNEFSKLHKTNDFEVVGFGEANYKFDEAAPLSYFVQYKTNKNKELVTVWGKNLQKAIADSDVNLGDRINLKKAGKDEKGGAQWTIKIIEAAKKPQRIASLKDIFGDKKQPEQSAADKPQRIASLKDIFGDKKRPEQSAADKPQRIASLKDIFGDKKQPEQQPAAKKEKDFSL